MSRICKRCNNENSDTASNCIKCRKPLLLEEGFILKNRYKILHHIKSGGMGIVYKAFDNISDVVCVVKEMLPSDRTPGDLQKFIEVFERESRILSTLDHPDLPKVFDYFASEETNRYYLCMTFIEGEDLDTILKREGTPGLPQDKVIKWSIDVLNILDYIHNQNPPIVYRDLKPSNIMIQNDGHLMLIDFGIARIIAKGTSQKIKTINTGTKEYMPIEQLQGQPEPGSDLYALGATMYHLLTGEPPAPLNVEKTVIELNRSVSLKLNSIIMKALRMDVSKRFTSARTMKEELEKVRTPVEMALW